MRSLRSRSATRPSLRTSSTEASPTNSFSSQPCGVPGAGRWPGISSVIGTRTRPCPSGTGTRGAGSDAETTWPTEGAAVAAAKPDGIGSANGVGGGKAALRLGWPK